MPPADPAAYVTAMAGYSARLRQVAEIVLVSPAVVPVLASVFVVIGLICVVTDYTLNNEGLLTHHWASWVRRDFVPVFFFQKVKPVLCALYAPISVAGPRATLMVHVLVASSAVMMTAATARSLGHRLPNLPALAVGLSPLLLYGAPAGVSNVDGAVGVTLVLYLLCARGSPGMAGFVAGLLPWVRFELASFSAVLALYGMVTPGARRMLPAMAVFPLFYWGGGAIYHGDVLWLLHYPPSSPLDPENPIYKNQLIGLHHFLEPIPAVTPVAVLAVAQPWRRLRGIEGLLGLYALLTVVLMNVLPILQIGNFGAGPRYLLHVLPAAALLAGRAIGSWEGSGRPDRALLLLAAVVGLWVASRQLDARAGAILVAAYAVVLGAAACRAATVAAALVVALLVAGPLLPLRIELTRGATAGYLDPVLAWLRAHPEHQGAPIYTNAQLLAFFLSSRLPQADVHHLATLDMGRELTLLTNPHNGQRARIRHLSAIDLYGRTLLPPVDPDDLPEGALLVLRDDARLPLLLPPALWSSRLEWITRARDFQVGQLRPRAAAALP